MYHIPMKNPKQIKCSCGEKVTLTDALTNECEECGQLFNGGGQKLAPRKQWENEWEDDY